MPKTSDPVFIDTSFFKALVDSEDEFHKKALNAWGKVQKIDVTFVSSNYILDETFTLIRVRCGLEKVEEFRKLIAVSAGKLKIARVTVEDEAGAWHWFRENWSGLSFTDCVSFSVMKRLSIKKALTFDKHFKRAGFGVV